MRKKNYILVIIYTKKFKINLKKTFFKKAKNNFDNFYSYTPLT